MLTQQFQIKILNFPGKIQSYLAIKILDKMQLSHTAHLVDKKSRVLSAKQDYPCRWDFM